VNENEPDLWNLEKAMEAKIKDNGGGCVRACVLLRFLSDYICAKQATSLARAIHV